MFISLFRMRERCPKCGAWFDREPGFYLGAIYFNYGLTSLAATVAYPLLTFGLAVHRRTALACLLVFVVLFPIWFFRYARSLWLGFDEYFDPSDH
jgi:hypothetical protein